MLEYNDLGLRYDNENLLFHYTKTSTAITKILYSRALKFGPLSKTNDPMEFKDPIQMLTADFHIDRDDTFRILEEIRKAADDRKNKVQLLCFSIDKFENGQTYSGGMHEKGWARSRMWAQYAENHKGVCLVFYKDKLLIEIDKEIKKRRLKSIQVICDRIKYSNDVKEYENAFSVDITEQNVKDDFTNFYLKNKEQFLFQKLEDYRDEQEYRIVLLKDNGMNGIEISVNIENAIAGIITGCDFEPAFNVNIQRISEKYNIPCFHIDWEYGSPSLYKLFG